MKKVKNKALIIVSIAFAVLILIFLPIAAGEGQGIAFAYGFIVEDKMSSTIAISPGINTLQLVVCRDWTIEKMELKFSQKVSSCTVRYKCNGQSEKITGIRLDANIAIFTAENDKEWQDIAVASRLDNATLEIVPINIFEGYFLEIEVFATMVTEMTISMS